MALEVLFFLPYPLQMKVEDKALPSVNPQGIPPSRQRGVFGHGPQNNRTPPLRNLPGVFPGTFSHGNKFSTSGFSLKSAKDFFLKA
jgi:hypothetical protein